MAYGVVTYSNLTSKSSDQVITNAVGSLWNAYAGVNPKLISSE